MGTLRLFAICLVLGLSLGLLVGLGRLSKSRLINWPLIAYIEAFRCTPLLVQIVWFYYALPVVLGVQIPATLAATMTLSLYTGAFYAEIFRGGIVSIEQGQWDAARALGLRPWAMMRMVILPQAVRNVLPDLLSNTLEVVKLTSLGSVVAVPELLYQARQAQSLTFNPTPIVMAAVVYFLILWPMVRVLSRLENRALAARR